MRLSILQFQLSFLRLSSFHFLFLFNFANYLLEKERYLSKQLNMIQIIQVQGTEERLYQLVAPLVMDPAVLRANNNYPFKTSERYVWFIAIKDEVVVGFIPVEQRASVSIINNYYVAGDNSEVLETLLAAAMEAVDKERMLSAVVLEQHLLVFQKCGFAIEKAWKRYIKMQK